jgi:hypothetical protein
MLNNQAKNILLKENENNAFYLYASNKVEAERIKKAMDDEEDESHNLTHQIETIGQSILATEGLVARYIPIEYYTIRREALENNPKKTQSWAEIEYKCYCTGKKIIENNILLHENALSAFRCALLRLGNPDYVYIIKIKKETIKDKLDNLKESYEDNSRDTSICEESTDVEKSTT